MSEPFTEPGWISVLRGAFGSFQAAAQERLGTSSVWSAVRQNVGSWSFAAQGVPQPWSPAELEETGTRILSEAGVSGANVSTFRGIAGQWLGAKTRLHQLGMDQQIEADHIFAPPWGQTVGSGVPAQYRIRTQWQLESATGDIFTRWKSDMLTTPLTTLGDAIDQAQAAGVSSAGHGVSLAGTEPVLLDYEIEQV